MECGESIPGVSISTATVAPLFREFRLMLLTFLVTDAPLLLRLLEDYLPTRWMFLLLLTSDDYNC